MVIKSMSELDSIPLNGCKVVSLFSGCGGSSLGLRLAGFKVLSAVEFIPEAAKTYKSNFPDTYVYEVDIRDLKGQDILSRFGLKVGEVDLLEGSPPCSDFSKQRNKEGKENRGKYKVYSDTKQRVDDLFYEYCRVLKEIKPKVFLAENVENLVYTKYYKEFVKSFEDAGYVVRTKVLNCEDYGIPQSRKRLIFIGFREDIGFEPTFPKQIKEKITTKDAIGDLVDSVPDMEMTELEKQYCKIIPVGAGISYLKSLRLKGIKIMLFNHRRDVWDKPHPTLVHNTRPIHQLKNRWLTVLEGKRLHGFPDDFVLTGTTNQQWERIGRAVPPLLYYIIGKHLYNTVFKFI